MGVTNEEETCLGECFLGALSRGGHGIKDKERMCASGQGADGSDVCGSGVDGGHCAAAKDIAEERCTAHVWPETLIDASQ